MNHYEFAEYLRGKGHNVDNGKVGIDFEAFLLGLNSTPIDFIKLYEVAEIEGYVYDSNCGWVTIEFQENQIKKIKKEIV